MSRVTGIDPATSGRLRKTRAALMLSAIVLCAAGIQAPALAGPIDSLAPGHWYEVPNSKLSSVDPCPANNCSYTSIEGQDAVIDDWNGGAFASGYGTQGAYIVFGGGHRGYFGNEVYAFDVAQLKWTRITNPVENPVCNYSEGELQNGSPCSAHTYDYVDYHPKTNSFVELGSTSNHEQGGGGSPRVHLLNLDTKQWRRGARRANFYDQTGASSAYDPNRDIFWFLGPFNNYFASYDPNADAWKQYQQYYIEIDGVAAIDPTRDLYVVVEGRVKHQIFVFDLKQPGAPPVAIKTTGDLTVQNSAGNGFDWDPAAKAFIGWAGGTAVYKLTPPSGDWRTSAWTWTRIDAASGNTVSPGSENKNNTYSRWRYVPSLNAWIVVNSTTSNVFFYKVSDAAPSTDASVSLTASPQSVSANGTTTLTWSSQNTSQCSASGGWSGTKATSGSQVVGPLTAPTTYSLSCTNAAGKSASASTSITIAAPTTTPPALTLSASPDTVTAGTTSTLTWSSTNTTSCTASGGWSGNQALSGSVKTAAISQSTAFTLDCTGSGGTVRKSVTVNLASTTSAPTLSLSASPATIQPGQTTALQWTSTDTTSCTASGGWSGNQAISGSATVGPLLANTSYSLSCTGKSGSVQKSAQVTVTAASGGSSGTDTSSGGTTPIGSALTSVLVTSQSTSAQTQVPVTFGEVFRRGDIPAGAALTASLADGTRVPVQVDKKATNPDGSLRTAVLSARIPSVAAGSSVQLRLASGGTAPSGSAVQLSELLATSFDASVNLSLGGTQYSATARQLLQAGTGLKQWLSGPIVSEWVVGGPVKTSSGAAHPHLTAYFHVRAYRGASGSGIDKVRVDAVVENGWTMVNGPATFNYTADIKVGGQSVYSRSISHYHHTRWHKQFWWQGAPSVTIAHDTTYLQNSRAVPAYANAKPTAAYLSGLRQDAIPMDHGDLTQYFPDTGAQNQIGPLPVWAANYITSGADARAYRNLLANDDSAGSYSVHYRDEKTGYPVSIADRPTLSLQTDELPAVSGSNPNTEDNAHQPSIGFLSYLVTGDYFYMEEMQFWTSWNHLWMNPDYRQQSKGIFGSQVRSQAWSLRNLGQSAFATPDSHPLKSHYVASVGNNVANYVSKYSSNASANKLGAVASYDGYAKFSAWQDDFLTWTLSYLVDLGFDARAIRDWKFKFPIGRMGTTDYCYLKAAIYTIKSGTSDSAWYPDFRTLYSANFGTNSSCPEGATMDGYPDSPTGYPSNLRPALVAAVEANAAGAADAWKRFTGSKVQPNFTNMPVWALVPRSGSSSGGSTGGGTTTPPPTPAPAVTLTASPASITSGGQSTLQWSSTNATSCTASGGWTGTKATSGSQAVSGLTQSTSYTLACTGAGGTGQASATIAVTTAPATGPALILSASPTTVTSGSSSKLTWSATSGSSCTASGAWSGSKAASGTQVISNITRSSTYTLSCSLNGASTAKSAQVTVSTTSPSTTPTLTLSATPTSITAGQSAVLSWSSTNATACTASGAWSGSKTVSGSATVGPLSTSATYSLSCTGTGGSIKRDVTVTVGTTSQKGGLEGNVDSSLVDNQAQNRIYVYAGKVTPRDYQGGAGDPLFSVPVEQENNACTFRYSLPSLAAGTYTLAFTNQAAKDSKTAADSIAFVGTTNVTVGSTVVTSNFDARRLLRVGPGKPYTTIRAAAAAATTGTVIEVDVGTYPDDIVVMRTNNVVIRGVGTGRPHVRGTKVIPYASGDDLRNGKGLWVVRGTWVRVENIEFSGARVSDENGAGIRNEGRNLTICNSYFHDNENGFLGEAYGTLTIEYSTFANNGISDGHTHNVYVGDGGTANETLVFRHNDSNHAKIGHLLKSRASINYILYNRLVDELDGTSSYNIDVPNGGTTYVIGNVIEQGPNTDNSAIIAYGAEGLLSGRTHALYLINNTLVNDRGSGQFVTAAGGTSTYRSVNNLFVGGGTLYSGAQPQATSNLTTSSPMFVNKALYDYQITSSSPARNVGTAPGSVNGVNLTPVWQYVDPAGREARPVNQPLDVGAFEYSP